eukprot:285101-Ditylum_brightwellii.AAC.1
MGQMSRMGDIGCGTAVKLWTAIFVGRMNLDLLQRCVPFPFFLLFELFDGGEHLLLLLLLGEEPGVSPLWLFFGVCHIEREELCMELINC